MEQSLRKHKIIDVNNELAVSREDWIQKNRYFHEQDWEYLKFLAPKNLRVLDLGCGVGDVLNALEPSVGVGVDISPKMVEISQKRFPHLKFHQGDIEDKSFVESLGGPFDIIVLSDTIGFLEDCQQTLTNLLSLCTPDTRIIISYYAKGWEPLLRLAEKAGKKMPQLVSAGNQNSLSTADIIGLLDLSGYETIKREWRQLIPKSFFGIGTLINRYIGTLPGIRRLCLRNYIVARLDPKPAQKMPSTTVLITCRNEEGNIEAAIQRLPRFCDDLEILFVEGHSKDNTLAEIHRVIAAYPQYDIKVLVQPGKGKGDAVRCGFDAAKNDILMILDGDLTTPPEDMPKFYHALASGKGEFINGTRLIYPMENQAMQFLNFLANKAFSWIFSYLLNQRFTDTLCGTKVLYKRHYLEIARNRHYFGDFDPFGDFDLIFGAAKLNLKVIEIPVRYAARTYGTTNISRFQHGWLLLKMVVFAFRKLKAF